MSETFMLRISSCLKINFYAMPCIVLERGSTRRMRASLVKPSATFARREHERSSYYNLKIVHQGHEKK